MHGIGKINSLELEKSWLDGKINWTLPTSILSHASSDLGTQ